MIWAAKGPSKTGSFPLKLTALPRPEAVANLESGQGRRNGAVCGIDRLIAILDSGRPVIVQTHDWPDLDAVASAWGLALLLRRRGFPTLVCHRGRIRSRSLSRLVSELRIELCDNLGTDRQAQIVVVDGSPANGNVELFPGCLVGVIDHHRREREPEALFVDIRPELASCSTLIHGYWSEAGEPLPRDLGTALIAGIQSDTDFLARSASACDFAAYTALFGQGDFALASQIVRTAFDLRELDLIVKALAGAVSRQGLFFGWLSGPCGQEVLGVLADFVLRAEELDLVVIAEFDEGGPDCEGVHISARSKNPALSAFSVVTRALEGIGSGGGHSHSAGGFVPRSTFPGTEALRERFLAQSNRV
jgi:nanoRNase/pAp phosphatase (c-di-AMP/oligoRNAs hydrolase)